MAIEALGKFLPFPSLVMCVDSLKPEDAGSGSSPCAGLLLGFPPLFLQQSRSLTTDRWPQRPLGLASHLCLFIGFALFLTLRSSPEFHLFLAPQMLLQLTFKNFPTLSTLYALKPGLWLRGSKDLHVSEMSPLFIRCSSEFIRGKFHGAQRSLHPKALLNNYLLMADL